MISQELLEILRCPLDPDHNARLEETADGLVCIRCRLIYPVREGIPCMLVEDAQLPENFSSLSALPCQSKSAQAEARQ
jgi:uncharacterized protein YbaR (Trm112 family)